MANDSYESVLSGRYASREARVIFSNDCKFGLWRELWLAIAVAQKQLGVEAIRDGQLDEMAGHLYDINYARAAEWEKRFQHDVLAHAHIFADVCPKAAPIIHLGLTSCDITDNAELVQMRDALLFLAIKLAKVIHRLAKFAARHRQLPTLGFTHIQPAQPITVGKRACMWLQDLIFHLHEIETVTENLRFRGIKGATGTQDAMLAVFKGDGEKVAELERMIADKFGFKKIWPITGQTYPRVADTRVLQALAALAASIHKICLDLRMLQAFKEIEEPFGEEQKGSSAMPYKRNPMRLERADSLARHVMALAGESLMTQALQIFERTLDDSAGRRIYIPEAFLATDALLIICQNVFEGLVVYPNVICRRLKEELPFLATERIIVAMVEAGGDRQVIHGRLTVHAQAAGDRVKLEGAENDLMERIRRDKFFSPIAEKLDTLFDSGTLVGLAPEQANRFLDEEVAPALARYPDVAEGIGELLV